MILKVRRTEQCWSSISRRIVVGRTSGTATEARSIACRYRFLEPFLRLFFVGTATKGTLACLSISVADTCSSTTGEPERLQQRLTLSTLNPDGNGFGALRKAAPRDGLRGPAVLDL
jgi:hypothetical protein